MRLVSALMHVETQTCSEWHGLPCGTWRHIHVMRISCAAGMPGPGLQDCTARCSTTAPSASPPQRSGRFVASPNCRPNRDAPQVLLCTCPAANPARQRCAQFCAHSFAHCCAHACAHCCAHSWARACACARDVFCTASHARAHPEPGCARCLGCRGALCVLRFACCACRCW